MDLRSLQKTISDCRGCALSESRTNIVFGYGSPEAGVMFIGEAPGSNEDKKGYPFVGAAGKLLDQLLDSIDLSRDKVYIANVLKCRPPKNRNPRPGEIEACKGNLFNQIQFIDPEVIVPLGNFAAKLILNTESGIGVTHGRACKVKDKIVFPVYHPAAGLYAGAVKEALINDFKELGVLLEGLQSQKNANLPNEEEHSRIAEKVQGSKTALW